MTNTEYHGEKDHISSTSLKKILESPLAYKMYIDNKPESSVEMKFGTAVHELIESMLTCGSEYLFEQKYTIFEPPPSSRSKSGVMGKTSDAYIAAFKEAEEKTGFCITPEDYEIAKKMVKNLFNHKAFWTIFSADFEVECTHLFEDDGVKQKVRPDVETAAYIIDFKTCGAGVSSINEVHKAIINYDYDLSAAMYQNGVHKATGVWKPFLWIFLEKTFPYQVNFHTANNWAYSVRQNYIEAGIGAIKYRKAIEAYKDFILTENYLGSEVFINNKRRIGNPQVPYWYANSEFTFYKI